MHFRIISQKAYCDGHADILVDTNSFLELNILYVTGNSVWIRISKLRDQKAYNDRLTDMMVNICSFTFTKLTFYILRDFLYSLLFLS